MKILHHNDDTIIVLKNRDFISLVFASELYLEYLQNKEKDAGYDKDFSADNTESFKKIEDALHNYSETTRLHHWANIKYLLATSLKLAKKDLTHVSEHLDELIAFFQEK